MTSDVSTSFDFKSPTKLDGQFVTAFTRLERTRKNLFVKYIESNTDDSKILSAREDEHQHIKLTDAQFNKEPITATFLR